MRFKAVHVPSRTVTSISAETVIELSQIDNIVGLREASGDLGQAARILDGTNKDSLLYSGADEDPGSESPMWSIGGSEGSVVLTIEDMEEDVDRAFALVKALKGEPVLSLPDHS